MPRTKSQEKSSAPTSMVASAARIRGGGSFNLLRNTGADSWHTEAWKHYRNIGEFRYACDWVGAQLSKALIHATIEQNGETVAVTEGAVVEILSDLFGNADGRAEMFRLVGIHMSVTGECWIVGYPDPDEFGDGGDKWEVAASTKCTRPFTDSPTDWWKVNDVTLTGVDPSAVLAIRIWRPDPFEPTLSISPARAIMSTLRQLDKLSQYISAQLDSRLAGAGILLMPTTMSFPAPPGEGEVAKAASSAEDLMTILMEAMAASLRNRDDASALVPIVVTASADDIAAVKHMTFWSELDEHAIELRNEAIRRLALGMDMPPEVLQGAADANHWSAWQADESSIKSHTEPLLKIITTALGSHFLRPLLTDEDGYDKDARTYGGEPLAKYSVAADTSEMRLRPNRSKEALELYNLGELSGKALLRETGFDDNDAMDEEELARWLTRKVALGSTTPELVEAALAELGVTLTAARPAGDVSRETGTEGRPAPSLVDHPTNDIPDRDTGERRRAHRDAGDVPSADIERKASLLAASEQLVFRALERAGNKLKSKMQVKPTCAAAEIYKFVSATDTDFLLDDAWGGAPLIALRAGINEYGLESALREYTTELLTLQEDHDYVRLATHLDRKFPAPMEAAA